MLRSMSENNLASRELMQRIRANQKKRKKKFGFDSVSPYLYILPSLALFSLFVFYPFVRTIYLSFQMTNSTGEVVKYYALKNYTKTFSSPIFKNVMTVTFSFAIRVVVGSLLLGLTAALLANIRYRGRAFARTCFALPMAISSACIAVIASFLLHPTNGLINSLIGKDINWTHDKAYALTTVSVVTVWLSVGMNYIFLIAALQGVDVELYEAAAIEGVNFFQKNWHITLPSISPTLFYLLIINVTHSFQAYAQVNLLTGGGPGQATRIIVYQIYEEAFRNGKYGTAAAQSVVLFAIIFILTLIEFIGEKKVTYS